MARWTPALPPAATASRTVKGRILLFGYVTIAAGALTPEQQARYRSFYCGLCHTLKERYGVMGRMTLSYDVTFLYLLLSSLYEPEAQSGQARCLPHPLKPHAFVQNELCGYCCDMNIALAYHKCLDDWQDERSLAGRAEAGLLKKAYLRVQERYPEKCAEIEKCLRELKVIEQTGRALAGCRRQPERAHAGRYLPLPRGSLGRYAGPYRRRAGTFHLPDGRL